MSGNSVYSLINLKSSPEHYVYLFRSKNDGLKLVVHQYDEEKESRKVYNLGFGHWDEEREVLVDDEVYNGKDGRMVLNTVLVTIPLFFGNCPNDVLLVEGSDSSDHDFEQYVPGTFYTSVLIFKKK